MYGVLENGGIAPGGINFDSKVRRSSFEMEDLKEDRFFDDLKEKRYASFHEGIGEKIINDQEDLESLTEYALGLKDIKVESSHIEYVKSCLNDYLV